MLNIVGGLDSPSEGHVFFKQEELTEFDDPALTAYRRDHVGFVFQLYDLIPSLTAKENVTLVTETAPNPVAPEKALTLVGLGDRINHFPSQLSGGDQQRVAIARAIAKRPEILLYDEPTEAPNLIATRVRAEHQSACGGKSSLSSSSMSRFVQVVFAFWPFWTTAAGSTPCHQARNRSRKGI